MGRNGNAGNERLVQRNVTIGRKHVRNTQHREKVQYGHNTSWVGTHCRVFKDPVHPYCVRMTLHGPHSRQLHPDAMYGQVGAQGRLQNGFAGMGVQPPLLSAQPYHAVRSSPHLLVKIVLFPHVRKGDLIDEERRRLKTTCLRVGGQRLQMLLPLSVAMLSGPLLAPARRNIGRIGTLMREINVKAPLFAAIHVSTELLLPPQRTWALQCVSRQQPALKA